MRLPPFSPLRNTHVLGVSVVRPSESGGRITGRWWRWQPPGGAGSRPGRETVAFFAILARLVQVQVPALSFSALAHTQRPEGGGPQVFPGFGDKLPNFRGLTPKKPDSNFAY